MVILNEIIVKDNNRTVVYDYYIHDRYAMYFNKMDLFFVTYDVNISKVPRSILCIPFLTNFLPIAWFLNFKIFCTEVDKDFYDSTFEIKREYQEMFPQFVLGGELVVENVVENRSEYTGNEGMLFSGGIDSVATYVRHAESNLALFSIWGADTGLDDDVRWIELKDYNATQKYLTNNKKYNVISNLRTFYKNRLEFDLNLGWWGKVQHGLALLGVTAPLSYVLNINTIYIASTHTKRTQISWGSTPRTDEMLKWGNTEIIHDCYDLSRLEKVKLILDYSCMYEISLNVRVCYSERREGLNCGYCEKCLRTIMAIVLCGGDPNKFGFSIDSSFYSLVFKFLNAGIKTQGVYNQWKDLQSFAKKSDNIFVFEDSSKEIRNVRQFSLIDLKLDEKGKILQKIDRIKYFIINEYPVLFRLYMSFRLKLRL